VPEAQEKTYQNGSRYQKEIGLLLARQAHVTFGRQGSAGSASQSEAVMVAVAQPTGGAQKPGVAERRLKAQLTLRFRRRSRRAPIPHHYPVA